MSSTNKTEHLQLNQWVGTDPFRMADFNEDNQKIDAAIAACGNCHIATGTYVGTGVYGYHSQHNRITFEQLPKLLIIGGATVTAVFFPISRCAFCINAGGSAIVPLSHTWSDNTLDWYNSSSALLQLNQSDTEYHWLTIN